MLLYCIVFLHVIVLKCLHLGNMGSESSDKKLSVGGTAEFITNLPKFTAYIHLEGHAEMRNGLIASSKPDGKTHQYYTINISRIQDGTVHLLIYITNG